jgi:hypothetical protein
MKAQFPTPFMKWYYESNGQPQGPILDSELRQLRDESKISEDCLVWTEGMEDWAPLHSVWPTPLIPTFGTATTTKLPALNPPSQQPSQTNQTPSPGQSATPASQFLLDASDAGHQSSGSPPPPPPADSQEEEVWSQVARQTHENAAPVEAEPAWERPLIRNYASSFLLSTCDILFSTGFVFHRMPPSGGWIRPLAFMAISNLLGTVAMLECLSLLSPSQSLIANAIKTTLPVPQSASGMLLSLLSSTFGLPLFIICKSAFAHGLLKIVTGTSQHFQTTFRTLCYAYSANAFLWFLALSAILVAKGSGQAHAPEIAMILAMIAGSFWSVYVDVRALACSHGLDFWKVALTLLLPPAVGFGLLLIASLFVPLLQGS